jgi:hypothetical protein
MFRKRDSTHCFQLCKPYGSRNPPIQEEQDGQFWQHAWGSIEEHTTGRTHAELCKLLRVHDRVLHGLLQLPLGCLQTTDVVPGNIGHLHHGLAKGLNSHPKDKSMLEIGNI